jgi:putative transcriptional regulator
MRRTETVTSRVEPLRKRRGLTQEELGDRVGVTRQTIISIEKGNYVPSVLLALKLALVFEVTVEEVFTYEAQ